MAIRDRVGPRSASFPGRGAHHGPRVAVPDVAADQLAGGRGPPLRLRAGGGARGADGGLRVPLHVRGGLPAHRCIHAVLREAAPHRSTAAPAAAAVPASGDVRLIRAVRDLAIRP